MLKYKELFYKRSPLECVYTCFQRRLFILSAFCVLCNIHSLYVCLNPTWLICAWSYRLRKRKLLIFHNLCVTFQNIKVYRAFLEDYMQK
jgi:hypothetical protein